MKALRSSLLVLFAAVLSVSLLASCAQDTETENTASVSQTDLQSSGDDSQTSSGGDSAVEDSVTAEFLADYGLSGKSAKEIINELDATLKENRSTEFRASIRPNELILSDTKNREVKLPMPTDEFYISAAPYLTQTHDCYFHSLTTCTGELANTNVEVKVTDQSGEVILENTTKTFDNGFVGFWLPRGITGMLEISAEGKVASVPVSTTSVEDPTCLTTLKLQ